MSRDLPPKEFNAILSVPADKLPDRLTLVLRAIAETHRAAQYKDAIDVLVSKYATGTQYNPAVLAALLRALTGVKEVDLTQAALDFVIKGIDIPESIAYLQSRADTTEVAEKLQKDFVPQGERRSERRPPQRQAPPQGKAAVQEQPRPASSKPVVLNPPLDFIQRARQ